MRKTLNEKRLKSSRQQMSAYIYKIDLKCLQRKRRFKKKKRKDHEADWVPSTPRATIVTVNLN